MAGPTVVGFGDAKAQKKWAAGLFIETSKKSYWDSKFVKDSDDAVIQRLTDLESEAGDNIDFDLSVQLRQRPKYGDNRLEGSEEGLRFYSDNVYIDQIRHGVSVGGKMSRKRTAINMRTTAKDRLSDYWAKFIDEMHFIYLSGARGINEDFTELTTWAGHAQNSIQSPDTAHQMYASTATSAATITSSMKMDRALIERASVKASSLRITDPSTANMMPVMVDGQKRYVCLMSKWQAYDMRTADTNGWVELNKQLITSAGRNSPLFQGGLGLLNDVVLHEHESVIRFSTYGAGNNLAAARALFLGRQAGVVAYGSTGGLRFNWTEETKDHGNEPVIAAGIIIGVKKTRFNSKDFGVLALDTYSANPG